MSDTYIINSAGKPSITKDYNAKLDYTFDWSLWLTGISDTIVSELTSIAGDGVATIGSPVTTNTSTSVTVWVTGGTVGQQYLVTCKITTTGGRIDERTIAINVRDR